MVTVKAFGLPILLAAIGTASGFAKGQAAPPKANSAGGVVTIDIDGTDINTALKLLFKQAHISYFIEPDVKSKLFSAGLNSVPFRTALDTLLEDCGEPLMFRENHGVYRIFRVGPAVEGPTGEPKEKFGLIRVNSTTAESILPLVTSAFQYPGANVTLSTAKVQNILMARYPDTEDGEAMFREVQSRARLYDIHPKVIECQVQVDCSGIGTPGGKQAAAPVLALTSRTYDKSTAHFKISSAGGDGVRGKAAVDVCNLGLDVTPGINGDGTLSLRASGTLNLCVRLPGESSVRHIQTAIDYEGQLNGGNTVLLKAPDLTRPVVSSPLKQNVGNTVVVSTLQLAGLKSGGAAHNVQIRVVVTANILPNTFPQQMAGN